jgi:thymidylate kinase
LRRVIMLDHGPVFRLVVLGSFGLEITKSESYQAWWNKVLGRWSALLDTVIWLDAPDAVLFERINRRARSHPVNGRPETEVYTFLARYRAAYLDILRTLERNPRFRVFRFDTSRDTADSLAAKTWESLAALPNPC